MEKLIKKIKINTTIELLTGLHIGGSSDNVEIGGIDNPVIKIATKDSQPYIPGSSIKGKIRCLLEQVAGSAIVGGDEKVNNLFGITDKGPRKGSPSKVIVRDAYLTEESVQVLRNCPSMDMPFTESKWENVIDRTQGVAQHPRQSERVPAGAKFNVEFVINVWDTDGDGSDLVSLLEQGINLLQNDYLGGSGSRGYGQVVFGNLQKQEITADSDWK